MSAWRLVQSETELPEWLGRWADKSDIVAVGRREEGGVKHLSAAGLGRVVVVSALTLVLGTACGAEESGATCSALTPADLEGTIVTSAFNSEFEERGVESTPARLDAARANLRQLCMDQPERDVIAAARAAASKVAETTN